MKFILYIECLVIFTIYLTLLALVKKLNFIGESSDWYSQRGLHPWQARKALALYIKERDETLKEQSRKAKK